MSEDDRRRSSDFDIGKLAGKVEALEGWVGEISRDVKSILAVINQAKGGWRTLMVVSGLSGTLGAFLYWLLTRLFPALAMVLLLAGSAGAGTKGTVLDIQAVAPGSAYVIPPLRCPYTLTFLDTTGDGVLDTIEIHIQCERLPVPEDKS